MTWLVALACLLLGISSARADRVPANCNGSGLGISLFTSIPDVHIGDTLYYSINVFNGAAGSGRIACDATGITAFIVTPDGVTNNVTLLRTTLHQGESDFYLDVVSYVVRAQDIQPDGTLVATARDIGVIHQNDTDSVGGGFQGLNTEVNLPCVAITAFCVGSIGENGLITITGTVTNCGNNTLVGVVVTNSHAGGFFTVAFPTNLARGQSANFTGSYIPLNPCVPSTATLTVRATDEFTSSPRTVTNFTTVTCQNTLTAGIQVTKVCPPGPVSPGQLLTFSGTVSNTGNVTLTNIVVLNNQPAANTLVFTLPSLAPGAVVSFTGSYIAPATCSVADTLVATATSRCGSGVSSTASAICPILTTPQIAVAVACPVTPVLPGGSFTYTGTVRNTGNITLTNVVVLSDRPAPNTPVFTVASLAPGAIVGFTSSVLVPANACAVGTTFSGVGRDLCTLIAVTNTIVTTCAVTTAPAIVVTLACPVVPATAGGLVTYTGTVRNAGNVTLTNVTVVSGQTVPSTVLLVPSLAPGVTANFTASFTAPADACLVSSAVTATGNDACSAILVSSTAATTCALLTTPAIVVTQICPVVPAVPGGLLTYSGTVRNSGNVTLTNVVVINNLSGGTPIFTAAMLAPGVELPFTGSYLATTNCSITSVTTGTAGSLCGVSVTNTVSTLCPILTTPQIAVTATCPVTPILPGGSFTYTGTVRNTGNITLTNVVVLSDRPAANTPVFTLATLAPGAVAGFTGTYTVPADACTVTTTFSGTGRDLCTLNTVTNTVATTCTVTTAPAIVVTLACPVAPATAGGLVTYTGTVRNTGNVTLNNVFVVNNQPAANTPVIGPITLVPGAIMNFSASFTAPSDACAVSSTVVATGRDNCTTAQVSNTVTATCALLTTPAIVVTQLCPVSPAIPGGLLTYSGTVQNTGNITLTNVAVRNNLSGSSPIFTVATLAPGAVLSFTGSFLTPTNCSITSISTVTGGSICGVSVTNTASATCPILTTPAIVVTQICPVVPVLQGGILTYSGTVRNAGNVTLTNIIVVNNQPATNTVIFTLATLAPGATVNFTGSYQAPDDCCVVSSTVRASGQGCAGEVVTDTATRTCPVLATPRIVVTKICPTGLLRAGDLLTYSGTVSNAGTITLINVMVVNNQPGGGSTVLGPATMAPGESFNYTASYIIPADFCGTDTVTASGLDICTFLPVVSSATTTCPVTTSPRIAVTKNCPVVPTPLGGLYTYTGSVSNAGNVTLVNVFVVDNQPTNNTPVIGPITLAPGASATFSGSYLAPSDCCEIVDTVTARGQDLCVGSNVTATASTFCKLLSAPGIVLVQNCPPAPIPMGSVYSYSGYVTNTGNVVLTNVFVFGPQGTNSPLLGPIELAPGESEFYSGGYTVPFDTCSVAITTRGQDGLCGSNTVSNVTSCPVATTALLTLTQNCPVAPVIPGGLLTYSGTVQNVGNITLNNVVVTNSQSGNTPLITIATLVPGASSNFTGSYTAPATGSTTMSISTARAVSICAAPVTNTASSTCVIISAPGIIITKLCPPLPVASGAPLVFTGTVANTGNVTLTNVIVVNNQPAPNTPVFGPITLAPGAVTNFTGSYLAPLNVCFAADTVTVTARDASTGNSITNSASANCPITTTPGILIAQNCPPGPVSAGDLVTFTGLVSNTGNITLTNVLVFNDQPTNNNPVSGPFTLAPGASAPFSGSYIATGGSNPTTNTTIVTNSTTTITTNTVTPTFGTIDPVSGALTDRFNVVSNLNGLMFADQDQQWGPALFYATRHLTTGTDQFVTVSTIATNGAGTVTDRFSLSATNYDALTLAAPNIGHGEKNYYYVRRDNLGVSTFGVIKAAGASSSADLAPVLPNTGYKALAFAEADVSSFGANLLYYIREDNAGVARIGTIYIDGAMVVTDRYTLGTNANFDSLVFVPGTVSTWGTAVFAYLRRDTTGSIIGTINPVTQLATDRLNLGTNILSSLTFAATDVGYGPNLFYYLRPERTFLTTNTVTTFTTNSVVTFTPTNTVTATGTDICQGRTVAAAANCSGPVVVASPPPPAGPPAAALMGAPSFGSGFVSLSFPTENGRRYTVQFKNTLSDPTWTTLETVAGTGGNLTTTDAPGGQMGSRFYRVISAPE